MSNFDLTFCKVYIYAKGRPGINLGASHESCAHPIEYRVKEVVERKFCLHVVHCYCWRTGTEQYGISVYGILRLGIQN